MGFRAIAQRSLPILGHEFAFRFRFFGSRDSKVTRILDDFVSAPNTSTRLVLGLFSVEFDA